LGRTLAASVLVSAFLLSTRIYAGVDGTAWSYSRTLVLVAGVVLALAIVGTAGRLHADYQLTPEALRISAGKRRHELPYEQIVDLAYEPPLVTRREWLPSLLLVDRFGKSWRVPALLEDGERFVGELVRITGRDDLESYASARGLRATMARTRTRLLLGYGLALLVLVVSFLISRSGPA
jgi:hypothetical protein